MSPEVVGAVMMGMLIILMFLNIPISVCLIVASLAGLIILTGMDRSLLLAQIIPTPAFAHYTMFTFPAYLLMGEIADISGMMKDAFRAANVWLARVPGGLAMASIVGAGAFSAVSGSSMACAALMARVALPKLMEYKYAPSLASGALVAGGTLGNLIPPGITIIYYAILTESSIGQLFIACLIPGIVLITMYMIQIYIQVKRNPNLAPLKGAGTTMKEKLSATKYMTGIVAVFASVMGGIYLGVYTPSEAAAIGTVICLIYALIKRTIKGQLLLQGSKNALVITGMVYAMIGGTMLFTAFITMSQLPQMLADWLRGTNLTALQLVIALMFVYTILGTAMDAFTMVILTMPILMPLFDAFHINLTWFGVLVIIQSELSNITPPIGFNLFVVAGISKPFGIEMSTIFRGALPFCLTMVVFNALLIAFPQIAMWLVGLMNK